jgi:group I intron endonuclease
MLIPKEHTTNLSIFYDLILMYPTRDHLIRPRIPIKSGLNAVYILLNVGTGVFYFGSSNNVLRRLSEHRSDLIEGVHINRNLQNAFEQCFHFKVAVLMTESRDAGFTIEQQLLDVNNGNPLMANLATSAYASGLGKIPSEETRLKISLANMGKPCTPAMKLAVSRANTGRPTSSLQKQRVAASNKSRSYSDSFKMQVRERMKGNKYGLGHKVSEATLNSIRNLNLGKKLSEETKRKIMESREATRNSPDYNDPRNIAVLIEGNIYASISQAARKLNMLHGTVWGRVNSSNPLYSEWRYLNA